MHNPAMRSYNSKDPTTLQRDREVNSVGEDPLQMATCVFLPVLVSTGQPPGHHAASTAMPSWNLRSGIFREHPKIDIHPRLHAG